MKLATLAVFSVALALTAPVRAAEFAATGPAKETKLDPAKFLGAVKVTFDLQPTTMSFDLPWHFCSVAENGLKFAYFAAETYDPRRWDGSGANASFEPGMDKEGRFAQLTAGFGAPDDKIGPEFTFGIYMEKLLGEPILIIKTSWGGRSLHTDFRPPSAGSARRSRGS